MANGIPCVIYYASLRPAILGVLLGLILLFSSGSKSSTIHPMVQGEIEREQAQRLDQIEKNKQAVRDLLPLPSTSEQPFDMGRQCFFTKEIILSGNQKITDEELISVIKFTPSCIGLNEINHYLRIITNIYVKKGFVTSGAFLPAQDLSNEKLKIEIIEGKLESVLFNGRPEGFLNNAFSSVIGEILNLRDIEQGLDQINRLTRYNAQIKLLPGTEQGMSIVNVITRTGPFANLALGFNNSGQDSTGKELFSVSTGAENVFDALDKWSFNYSKSSEFLSTKDSESVVLALDIPRGYWNVGLSASYSRYLNTVTSHSFDFESTGRTNSYDTNIKWLFHRDAVSKSSFKWGVHYRQEKNYILGSLLNAGSRGLSSTSLSVDHSTQLFGGFFTVSPRVVIGTDWFGSKKDDKQSQYEPQAQFYKGTLTASYSYPINAKLNASSTLFGQWSNDKLYGNERVSIGGEYSVRGFKGHSISGDEGFYWRNDLTYHIGQWPYLGRVNAQVALDTGAIAKDQTEEIAKGSMTGANLAIVSQARNYTSSFAVGFPIQHPSRLNADDYVIYYRFNLNL